MVVHVFPAAKLGALLLKQISKPIANAVKARAKTHPIFRRWICLPPARFYNWCEVKSKMWLLKFGQPVNISVLNEEDSIELGANLLGEGVIFLIAAVILISEYNRSVKKEAAKEAKRIEELQRIQDALNDLFIQTEEQGAHIREITRKMGDLETRVVQKPWKPKKSDSSPEEPPPAPKHAPIIIVPDEHEDTEGPHNSPPQPAPPKEEQEYCEDGEEPEEPPQAPAPVLLFKPLVNDRESPGLIFKGLSVLEDEFFSEPGHQRRPGLITAALNHIYGDVYKTSLKF